MRHTTRRTVLAAVGASVSLSGCAGLIPSSPAGAEPTTEAPSERNSKVETRSEPAFVGEGFPLSLEPDANTVDELADATLVLVAAETSSRDRKLVDAVCGGSLLVFVGPDAGGKMETALAEGNARRCLPYATEGRSGAVVAGVHPASGELVTHYYGSSGENTQQYRYSSANDLISYYTENSQR
ncbi:hypothetical protein [Halobacterium jilantaiense]|uniref:Uncharacterized protein n=1 Tax=Halobacterium jilantaiense TaxID=355548 RepID=A0A1I0MUS5_9EURY|nr:hypothetical protein [Halobacterium jilantaiense]SEV92112.1 hypothetical protein SAMN04487945_0366 [Halobacterium jilantaiense]